MIHANKEGLMSRNLSYNLFETALGWMGIAWSETGIAAVQTPRSRL